VTVTAVEEYACREIRRTFWLWAQTVGRLGMTSLIEAESKFGSVVRDAGGAIFGIEKAPFVGSRQEEKLQIGTPDGFVKIAVLLNQPDIDAVLRERTSLLVRHAGELTVGRLHVEHLRALSWNPHQKRPSEGVNILSQQASRQSACLGRQVGRSPTRNSLCLPKQSIGVPSVR
jgi:hypothetical protein